MTVSNINPQMNRNKAIVIIAIIAVILLIAIFIPDDGGAIKSISTTYEDLDGTEHTDTYTGDKDANIYLADDIRLEIDGRDTLVRYDTVWNPVAEEYEEVYVATYKVVDGQVVIDGDTYDVDVNKFYTTFWALVPPLVAITLALITKEV